MCIFFDVKLTLDFDSDDIWLEKLMLLIKYCRKWSKIAESVMFRPFFGDCRPKLSKFSKNFVIFDFFGTFLRSNESHHI